MRTTPILTALAAALLAAGCGDSAGPPDAGLEVVATTQIAAELTRAVAGDRARVTALIPAGADPHGYEPRPDDVRAIARADLVVRSGGEIDEWLDEAIENAGSDEISTVSLLEGATSGTAAPPADGGTEAGHGGDADPHWWHDPTLTIKALGPLRAALSATGTGPDAASDFEKNEKALAKTLKALDGGIEACIATIPQADRKLVTSHDALRYFARRYGLEVVGAVIPSRSTQAQAASGTVAELVEAIRDTGVKAVFAEDSVNPRVERALAEEAGAKIGGTLYADGLGERGSTGETYLGALAANARTIAEGLGGDVSACSP